MALGLEFGGDELQLAPGSGDAAQPHPRREPGVSPGLPSPAHAARQAPAKNSLALFCECEARALGGIGQIAFVIVDVVLPPAPVGPERAPAPRHDRHFVIGRVGDNEQRHPLWL